MITTRADRAIHNRLFVRRCTSGRGASAGSPSRTHGEPMSALLPTPRRELAVSRPLRAVDADLRAGRSVAEFHGVHVDQAHATGMLTRTRAGLATQGPSAVAGMRTSAVLHRLRWLPAAWCQPEATIELVVPQLDAHRQRRGLRLHHRLLRPDDVTVVQGVPCLDVTRTLVELARDPAVPALVVVQIIDGALRDGRTTKAEMLARLERHRGERYVARARRLVESSCEGVDSPGETTIRLTLADAGIHVEPAIEICDDDGLLLARGDVGIRRYLLWGEYDGFDVHSRQKAFRGDRVGDRWLQRRGWHVMRFVDDDLRHPQRLCREWAQAIADAPMRIAALDPRRSPEIAEAHRLLGLTRLRDHGVVVSTTP